MGIRNDNTQEALMPITTIHRTLYAVAYVPGGSIPVGEPCEQCDNEDAFVLLNVYVREFGQCTRFAECCVACGLRIAQEESAAEVLIEVPESLRDKTEKAGV